MALGRPAPGWGCPRVPMPGGEQPAEPLEGGRQSNARLFAGWERGVCHSTKPSAASARVC